MKQFVALARVSSQNQKKEGWSLEEQEERLERFARDLGGSIVKLFKVAETASKTQERKTFRELTAYMKTHARRLDGALFVKVDRATRNHRDWVELEEIERTHGVKLYFPDQPSGDTPVGRFHRRMTVNIAAYQVEQQAVDIRAGHRRRLEGGLPNGKPPYGYNHVRTNGRSTMEVDPANGLKVQRIFALYASEPLTIDSLITRLASEGITYSNHTRLFPRSVLHRLLRNRHYLSEVTYDGGWHPGRFAPLIERATFNTVQDRLGGKVYHAQEMTYAGNIIQCGHCGHVVTGERKVKRSPVSGASKTYTYYRCAKYNLSGHPRVRLTEGQIEGELLALFDKLRLADDDARNWFVEVIRARARARNQEVETRRAELHRQDALVAGKLNKLLDMKLADEISREDYAAKRTQLADEQAVVKAQLDGLDRSASEIADLAVAAFELSQDVKREWVKADYHAKRTILGIIVKDARLNSGNIEFSLRKPFDLLRDGSIYAENGAMGI